MKRYRNIIIIFGVVVLLAAMTIALSTSQMFAIGERYRQSINNPDNTVVATYKGQKITREMVDFRLATNSSGLTEDQIITDLLIDLIVLDEAKQLGITITDEEVADHIAYLKDVYTNYPEAKETIDEFCAGAGITIDRYWEIQSERTYNVLLQGKYEMRFKDNYNSSSTITNNSPDKQDVWDAYELFRQQLLQEHSDDITYYP